MTQLWIVGKTLNVDQAWEFQGVFDTKEAAIAACVTNAMFIGDAVLNHALPVETCEWNEAFYPRHKDYNDMLETLRSIVAHFGDECHNHVPLLEAERLLNRIDGKPETDFTGVEF